MFLDAIVELARTLTELGVRWVLIGAVAANVYRRQTRLTGDVDLLLADAGTDVERVEAAFRERGWTVRRATPGGDVLRMRHADYGSSSTRHTSRTGSRSGRWASSGPACARAVESARNARISPPHDQRRVSRGGAVKNRQAR